MDIFLHIFLLFVAFTKGKGLDVTAEHSTTDIGHGAFDEWFKYFHREISIALSAVGKSNVSNSCKSHLFSYLYDLESDKPWAVQMWDSMDALPAGILQGNVFFWPGSLDECLQIVEMKPQYCLTRMSINSTRSQNLQFLFLSNSAVSIWNLFYQQYVQPKKLAIFCMLI
uniref:Nose resistant-to-fluoxetine protein N-terminal domain-containing protein n=1 Tax=Strigamia maritima TaxID=126957 RepID=T1IKF0_STRMM